LKIYIESYGCTLNHGEARNLIKMLGKSGHMRVSLPEEADIIVLFTCTVIRTTELKMLRRVKEFKELDKPVMVSGCMAVVQQQDVLDIDKSAYFLPPAEINGVHLLLNKIKEKYDLEPENPENHEDRDQGGHGSEECTQDDSIDSIVPISTGCLGQCTYCITRLARGGLQSYPVEHILDAIRKSLDNGNLEIRLTAQDTGCYGYDNDGTLPELLDKISCLSHPGNFRVRVGMMNPDSVGPNLTKLVNSYQHQRIFKFLHIPVQTGDDRLLKDMGRRYSVSDFFKIIDIFRKSFPKITISTDIIIGYPTESDSMFENSIKLIRKLRPNIVNITRFSARPGTMAGDLKNRIPGRVVKARSRSLTKLRFKISKDLNVREVGNTYPVLITERVKPGTVLARNDNYTPIVIKEVLPLGSWQKVAITDSTDTYLIGKRI
jgi:MiaB-like tRNA modifying enzyme